MQLMRISMVYTDMLEGQMQLHDLSRSQMPCGQLPPAAASFCRDTGLQNMLCDSARLRSLYAAAETSAQSLVVTRNHHNGGAVHDLWCALCSFMLLVCKHNTQKFLEVAKLSGCSLLCCNTCAANGCALISSLTQS